MDRHADAGFLRDRNDLAQEGKQVLAQALERDVLVDVERLAKALAVEDELARRHPADEVLFQPRQLAFAHRSQPFLRRGDAVGRMVRLGARPLQHQHVIGAEIDDIEAQRGAAMRHRASRRSVRVQSVIAMKL